MEISPSDRELLQRIDEVLHYEWDPIGVADVPEARDEYASYVPEVFALLSETHDGKDVVEHLERLSTDHMAVGSNLARSIAVVETLLRWRNYLRGRSL